MLVGRAVLALALVTSLPCAAQPAGEKVDPFLVAGALGLEADVEACKLPASDSQKEELRQAIRAIQLKAELPDAFIAKVRQDLQAARSEQFWTSHAREICQDLRAKFTDNLAEVVRRSK